MPGRVLLSVYRWTVPAVLVAMIVSCSPSGTGSSEKGSDSRSFRPLEADTAIFWDRQTSDSADELAAIVDEYNASHEGVPIKAVSTGNYGDIYKKVVASTRAGVLPAMAVAYENMTAEYMRQGAVKSLDDYIANPETGLSEEELNDFFPAMLDTNRFAQFDGQTLSFPYTKSVLVMYYNLDVMRAAGLDAPPTTWEEFVEQCRVIKQKTGKFGIALDVDCSTISGIIFSMGGEILGAGETLYDSPASIRTFELIETLMREKLAYQIPPRTFNDETSFGNDEIAFILRTSAQRPYLKNLIPDSNTWGIAAIPQADPADPHTALFGGNVTLFQTTPEQQASAWGFMKYFTSPETTARWALATGYLPVRRSAADDPALQAFWAEWPSNKTAFDCLEFAKPEPNILAWQEIRSLVEKAETAVIAGMKSGREAAEDLKRDADALIKKQ
ncbi:MAG: ABC transporter substrate-binding protein [Candidatus Hydrogenedentota bacterium]